MSQWELVKTHKRLIKEDTTAVIHRDVHIGAEGTYSALELGAGETQTTCGEDCLTSLLLLHHGEAVTVSPAKMHQVSASASVLL